MSKDQNPANIRFVMKKVGDVANRYGQSIDAMALFDMAVSLLSEIPNLPEPGEEPPAPEVVAIHEHLALVRKALTTPAVMEHVRTGQSIYAIKALREVTLCTLKEAKEAINDYSVQGNKGETDSYLARLYNNQS